MFFNAEIFYDQSDVEHFKQFHVFCLCVPVNIFLMATCDEYYFSWSWSKETSSLWNWWRPSRWTAYTAQCGEVLLSHLQIWSSLISSTSHLDSWVPELPFAEELQGKTGNMFPAQSRKWSKMTVWFLRTCCLLALLMG